MLYSLLFDGSVMCQLIWLGIIIPLIMFFIIHLILREDKEDNFFIAFLQIFAVPACVSIAIMIRSTCLEELDYAVQEFLIIIAVFYMVVYILNTRK